MSQQGAGFHELEPVLQVIAKTIGENAVLKTGRNSALITSRPFALLLSAAVGGSVQAYCSVHDQNDLSLAKAMRFGFHQYGDPLRTSSWIWFPRLAADGATAYKWQPLGGTGNGYEWSITRVQPAVKTRYEAKNLGTLVTDMGSQITRDYLRLRDILLCAVDPVH